MERLNYHNTGFNPASVFAPAAPLREGYEDWILEQLFGIRSLEKMIAFNLANSNGRSTPSLQRDMETLQARVDKFNKALDSGKGPNPAQMLRAS